MQNENIESKISLLIRATGPCANYMCHNLQCIAVIQQSFVTVFPSGFVQVNFIRSYDCLSDSETILHGMGIQDIQIHENRQYSHRAIYKCEQRIYTIPFIGIFYQIMINHSHGQKIVIPHRRTLYLGAQWSESNGFQFSDEVVKTWNKTGDKTIPKAITDIILYLRHHMASLGYYDSKLVAGINKIFIRILYYIHILQ